LPEGSAKAVWVAEQCASGGIERNLPRIQRLIHGKRLAGIKGTADCHLGSHIDPTVDDSGALGWVSGAGEWSECGANSSW
jgi:hypothetical protein